MSLQDSKIQKLRGLPKPLRMASDNKKIGYRIIEAIHEKQNDHTFIYPGYFPLQPFHEWETLIKKLDKWAIKHDFRKASMIMLDTAIQMLQVEWLELQFFE